MEGLTIIRGWTVIVVLVVMSLSLCVCFAFYGFYCCSNTIVEFTITPMSLCVGDFDHFGRTPNSSLPYTVTNKRDISKNCVSFINNWRSHNTLCERINCSQKFITLN